MGACLGGFAAATSSVHRASVPCCSAGACWPAKRRSKRDTEVWSCDWEWLGHSQYYNDESHHRLDAFLEPALKGAAAAVRHLRAAPVATFGGTHAVEQKSAMTFQKLKDGVQFILLIFGAAFGIYTFIYKDIYIPAKRPPAVTLAATVEELDHADGMILIRAHLVVANRGDAKVWVPALWWNVYGVSLGGDGRTISQFVNYARPLLQYDKGVSRFSNIRSVEIVAAGYERDYELWYQPKDETVHEQLFLVPEERFDAVQIYVDAYIIKNIETLAPTRWEINDQGELTPTLLLKQKGWWWDKNSGRTVPFEPETNRDHRKIFDQGDAGHDFTTASLRIKPKSLAMKPGGQNTKH